MSSAQLHSNPKISQSGQGILEVIVTIGIGTIMIMALVVLSVRTNRSSDFSKASSQASSLASEGIEIITNLKEMNGTTPGGVRLFTLDDIASCTGNSSNLRSWDDLFGIDINDNISCPAGSHGRVGYIIEPSCNDVTNTTFNCISFPTANPALGSELVDTRTYIREVFIADTPVSSTPPGKSNCNTNDDTDPNVGDWDNIKQFAVVVSWTDSSGSHNQTQTTCLQR